jgi:tetratricopeptide (TPR) repeat protein
MENLRHRTARANLEESLFRECGPSAATLGLMTKFVRHLLALALAASGATFAAAQVRVWQDTLVLPTYEEGQPDPNPPFDQLTTNRFNYPYTLRTNLTDLRTDHKWRAIFLENEYLKCSVLPDLGGHLYTCFDKIDGKPMFYANPSIKKANIGYRGTWAAFGDEFNFPVSHNWMSLSPIDFAFSHNADGSASVTVGNIDRVYGMEWRVEMVLRPKSTVLEQRVTLYNRSDVRHRFYWWNNAGVQVWDDSHVEYPMRFAASHGFTEVQPWPVDSAGRDLSIIRNQTDGPVSLFVHGSREPFMGVWNPHTNSGTAHFANYDALPGKKTWSWGVDADGLDWRKALSDNDSAYVEVQGGLFRNQETYAFLEPRQVIHFSEFWMPVREIGGISRANLVGVLSLRREGNDLIIGFNPNQPLSSATVSVADGDKQVWSTRVDLSPERVFLQKIPLSNRERKYTIEIHDRSGAVIMRQIEDQYDWSPASDIHVGPQEGYKIPTVESRTEDDWIRLGETQELNGNLLTAAQTYHDLLSKNPQSYGALKAEGRISVTLLRYDEGAKYLEQVRTRNTTDGEAAYYLGLAYEGLGLNDKARIALESAYRLPQWRDGAAVRLGELSSRERNPAEAERYFNDALQSAPDDIRAAEELVAIKNIVNSQTARTLAQNWFQKNPTSDFLRQELGHADLQQMANDDSRILRLAAQYIRLGLYQKALDVLSRPYPDPLPDQSEPAAPAPARDPMLAYYRAYCRENLGQSARTEYEKASTLPTNYIFPNSAEDLTVLRSAVNANPADANAHYLLGTLYFSKSLVDDALGEWNLARQSNPKIPVLGASMGIALLHVKDDPEGALRAFSEGIHTDPHNELVYFGADQALSILGKPGSKRVHALGQYPDPAKMPIGLVYESALNLAESGDFDQAAALFHGRFFPREEGGTNVRQVWIEVQLMRALDQAKQGRCDQAISAANNLGAPVPDIEFTRNGMQPYLELARTNYLLGEMYAQCNRPEDSRGHFTAAAGKSGAGEIYWAWLAAKQIPAFNAGQWTARLQSALQQADGMTETSSFAGRWVYNRAVISRALGNESKAQQDLRKVFLLPDRLLSYHLARQAMAAK